MQSAGVAVAAQLTNADPAGLNRCPNLGTTLAERAATSPDDLALVVVGGEDLTLGRWTEASNALARGLAERGIGPGDRIALHFDAATWAGFAVAYIGVLQAGAVAVLVPAGLAPPDAARIIGSTSTVGVLSPRHLSLLAAPGWWTAPPDEVADGQDTGPLAVTIDPAALAEMSFPVAPMARPHPRACSYGDLGLRLAQAIPGWLVHAWTPGSYEGQSVITHVLSASGASAASLARFTPDGFLALVGRLGPTVCSLPSGLAGVLPQETAARLGSANDHFRASMPCDQTELAPAGASQLGMLWHEQLAPGSFNLPCLVRRYRGDLDVDAFSHALSELTRRHEPLRTTFEIEAGDAAQVVGAPTTTHLMLDLSQLSGVEQATATVDLIAEASRRPFDLVEGPLFDPRLVRLASDDHLLVLRLHHTTFDDWSVDVFRRQLSVFYASFLAGNPPTQAEPKRFSEICRRQRSRVDGDAGRAERDWWRGQMASAPLPVQLTLGHPEELHPGREGAGEPLRHDLDTDLAGHVRALARRLRATPFMTMLSAFALVLARRTGQDDLVLASVVAARSSPEVEPMIGCFTKKVLLRLRLDGSPSFAGVVARTRSTILDALAHQDMPFDAVVQQTLGRTAHTHGLAALVPVVFQGEAPRQARLALPGITAEPFSVPAAARLERHFSTGSKPGASTSERPVWGDGAYAGTFLLLSLLAEDDGLALIARGVFHRPAARQFIEEMETLLLELVAHPNRPLPLPRPQAMPDVRLARAASKPGERLGDSEAQETVDQAERHSAPVLWRGVLLRSSRIEAALADCVGVGEVAVAVVDVDGESSLVAYVVPDRQPPPTLTQLRAALWAALPGSPWPAALAIVDALPRRVAGQVGADLPIAAPEAPTPDAAILTALWSAAAGRDHDSTDSYWQDFSFLQALAEARAAGLPITDEQVMRCRTPEMLAAAMAAAHSVASLLPFGRV